VLFLIAERLRNLGRYTFADVTAFRLAPRPIRSLSATGTLTVVAFYLVAQMVGAGHLVELMFGMPYVYALIVVGALMVNYVAFGGMVATTWVQIIKACLLLGGATMLALMVLGRFGFSLDAMFRAATDVHPAGVSIMAPGNLVTDPISTISLGLALMFGTAGLPHILMRFFTVRDAKAARKSVFYATGFIGYFYILTFIIGFGAITFLMRDPTYFKAGDGGAYDKINGLLGGTNMAAVHLSNAVGGSLFLGFISAVAFATILAVVAGLTLAGASAVSHDLYANVVAKDRLSEQTEVRISKIAAVVIGIVAIILGVRVREAERRIPGRPRLRGGGELQFPGPHEHVLGRDDHSWCGRRRLSRPPRRGRVGASQPGGVGENLRLLGADLPPRQSRALLDVSCVPRHLRRVETRPEHPSPSRTDRLRCPVRARGDRTRGGRRRDSLTGLRRLLRRWKGAGWVLRYKNDFESAATWYRLNIPLAERETLASEKDGAEVAGTTRAIIGAVACDDAHQFVVVAQIPLSHTVVMCANGT
jgi:hypothetical protein